MNIETTYTSLYLVLVSLVSCHATTDLRSYESPDSLHVCEKDRDRMSRVL